MSPNPLPAQAIDLSSCDKEPIHIIGSIQPHGWLISCRLPGWEITQISENTQSFLGLSAENLLGQVFTAWLNLHDQERLEQHLQAAIETSEPKALKLAVTTPQGTGYFIALVHQNESAAEANP
jgi:chemotaxis family two-component system sensor kinase Cph1